MHRNFLFLFTLFLFAILLSGCTTTPVCGDGVCSALEDNVNSPYYCVEDCGFVEPVCGDGVCSALEDDVNSDYYCEKDCVVEEIVFGFDSNWVAEDNRPLKFFWEYVPQDNNYYVVLDLWASNNDSPLGSVDSTVERLKRDFEFSELTGREFVLPGHVFVYDVGFGELFYGGFMPKPFVFKSKFFLLDSNFDLLGLVGEDEFVLEDVVIPNFCGDGVCVEGEGFFDCPLDCSCGNLVCEDGEDISNCVVDCDSNEADFFTKKSVYNKGEKILVE